VGPWHCGHGVRWNSSSWFNLLLSVQWGLGTAVTGVRCFYTCWDKEKENAEDTGEGLAFGAFIVVGITRCPSYRTPERARPRLRAVTKSFSPLFF
jgi:hypothetical protein